MTQAAPYTHRKYHIIYKTTCIVTGRWYIGMHSTNNLNDGYKGSGTHLVRLMKKHGKDQHICEILEHHPSRAMLSAREEELITPEMIKDPMCMNKGRGGIGNAPGYHTLQETKMLIGLRATEMWARRKADPAAMAEHIKKIATPEIVAKRAAANTGKKRTPKQVENLNRGQQKYYESVDPEVLRIRGQKSAQTRKENGTSLGGRPPGIAMKEEQKMKQSNDKKGKRFAAIVRASCVSCRKETTVSAIKQFHRKCP